jgi:hypothetical protein
MGASLCIVSHSLAAFLVLLCHNRQSRLVHASSVCLRSGMESGLKWSHKTAAPTSTWVPPASRRAGRIAILVTEIIFAVAFLVVQPIFMTIGAFIDPEGLPITDLYVAPSSRAYTRSTDGELWLSGVNLDPKKHTVRISCYFIGAPTNYAWQLSDPNHPILTSVPPNSPKPDPKHKPAVPFTPPTAIHDARGIVADGRMKDCERQDWSGVRRRTSGVASG